MFHKLQRVINIALLLELTLFGDAHIFVYHRFDDNRYPSTNTSLQELKREFQYLKEHHYQVIPLDKLINALKNKKEIKNNWVVLTIDDGYKSFLKAFPLFQKYHYPFTLFIATKPIQEKYPDFLSWSDLKKIVQFGSIGFHSHTHPHLVDLSDEMIKKDTTIGLQMIESQLGIRPTIYAYPYGEYDKRVKNMIEKLGFEAICNQNLGAINKSSSPYDLDRIALVGKSDIQKALKMQRLNVEWIEPKEYPKDKILKKVIAYIEPLYKKASLYVTGYGWKSVNVVDGRIEKRFDYRLTKKRVRVIIKVKNSKINTKLLVRSRYGVK